MLSKPKSGWSEFTLGDFKTCVSYLVDIPFDWLISCKNAMKHNIPVSFFLELEGEECIVTSYNARTHIVISDEEDEYMLKTVCDVDFIDLSAMLLEDIKKFFDDWVKWNPYEQTQEDFTRRQAALKELVEETEGYLTLAAKKYNKKL